MLLKKAPAPFPKKKRETTRHLYFWEDVHESQFLQKVTFHAEEFLRSDSGQKHDANANGVQTDDGPFVIIRAVPSLQLLWCHFRLRRGKTATKNPSEILLPGSRMWVAPEIVFASVFDRALLSLTLKVLESLFNPEREALSSFLCTLCRLRTAPPRPREPFPNCRRRSTDWKVWLSRAVLTCFNVESSACIRRMKLKGKACEITELAAWQNAWSSPIWSNNTVRCVLLVSRSLFPKCVMFWDVFCGNQVSNVTLE